MAEFNYYFDRGLLKIFLQITSKNKQSQTFICSTDISNFNMSARNNFINILDIPSENPNLPVSSKSFILTFN